MAKKVDKNSKTPNGGYEWEYAKKTDDRSVGEKIGQFIYNKDTSEILGRTIKSWGALALFYIIFYSVLALLFGLCMHVLMLTLNDIYPKWQLSQSLIGDSPGLGFRPMANNTDASAVIWFNKDNKKSWIDAMKKFRYDNYRIHKSTNNQSARHCSYNNGQMKLEPNEFCLVDLDDESFKECSASYSFGFSHQHGVCVFLKLNRIYNWKPDYYNSKRDLDSLPSYNGFPDHTKKQIFKKLETGEINQIWISCDGQSPHDKENIGEIDYYPGPGFPYYFYPYMNVKNYMSPLVAVHFKNATRHVLINVECRAWAKNIKYKATSQQREGSVHFELMID